MQKRNVKANISSDYLEEQRLQHGWKPWEQLHPKVIVTGSKFTNSIGRAIVRRLLQDNFHVTPNNDDLVNCNCEDMFLKANALVMSHGATYLEWFEKATINDLATILDVNLLATIKVTQAFVKQTLNLPVRKKIIAIGSMAYNHPLNGSAVYCASKAGLAMLMKCLAWELAPKGYDVYTIHPSNVADTPMSEETIEGLRRYRNMTLPEAEAYWGDSPIRSEILSAWEIADLVRTLLSPNTGYLSGAQLELGGGQR